MLTTNLATRPFYNERAVQAVLLLLGVVALSVMAFGALRLTTLSQARGALTLEAEAAERAAAAVTAEAVRLEQGATVDDLERRRVAAVEANRLIDERVFSWTTLLNVVERTLPAEVRLTAVRPRQTDGGGTRLEIEVVGRTIGGIQEFIERFEEAGVFGEGLAVQEEITDDRTYRALVSGQLVEGALRSTSPPAPAGM